MATKIPNLPLMRRYYYTLSCKTLRRSLCTAAETQTQKLERIADELIELQKYKLEWRDYHILFRLKLGLDKYGSAGVAGVNASGSSGGAAVEETKAEKTAFDIKLEKFDAAAKIKIIKEVRTFTDLGLKEAKELVEKAPIVLKKGLTKEEGETILEKLKALGATVVLE
ncbi:hypothetical protein ACHQM5_014893 [Ranunculus cassubicifolius]